MDAIALLKQQHREVDSLFERILTASDDEKILLLGKISEQLTIHAQLEERHVYPFARQVGIQDMVDHAIEEHAEVKQLIAEILSLKRHDPRVLENVQLLQQSVQSHVAEEESTFFPRLATLTSPEELMRLGMEMQSTMQELSQQELLAMAESQGAMSP
ncbi:MAG TPA: hemerythrin domain-containing protein [Myxococcaceae bacterium]|jgi:hemerythrin superfamily protein